MSKKEKKVQVVKVPELPKGLMFRPKAIRIAKEIFKANVDKVKSIFDLYKLMSFGENQDGEKAFISMKNGDVYQLFKIFAYQHPKAEELIQRAKKEHQQYMRQLRDEAQRVLALRDDVQPVLTDKGEFVEETENVDEESMEAFSGVAGIDYQEA